MMSEVRCDIYLHKWGDGNLLHRIAAREASSRATPGKGSPDRYLQMLFSTYISMCLEICLIAEGWAWPNLMSFSVYGPPAIKGLNGFFAMCHTTAVGEPSLSGQHQSQLDVLLKPVFFILSLLRATLLSLFYYYYFFFICISPNFWCVLIFPPLFREGMGEGDGWNKCHNNIPFQKNIV